MNSNNIRRPPLAVGRQALREMSTTELLDHVGTLRQLDPVTAALANRLRNQQILLESTRRELQATRDTMAIVDLPPGERFSPNIPRRLMAGQQSPDFAATVESCGLTERQEAELDELLTGRAPDEFLT